MANLRYITPNHLRRRANWVRALVLILGAPGALLVGLIHPLLALLATITLCAIWNRQYRLLIGAQGEDLALGVPVAQPGSLSTLPDDYIVFNQLRVPWRDTSIELDHVVIGPNGVFNVECKHWAGEISGSDMGRTWIQRRRVPGRLHATREMRSPLDQVRRSTYALATYLRSKGINVWVEAVTVFTHPGATLSVTTNSVPILTLPQLARHIENHQPLLSFRHQGATMRAIKLLLGEKRRTDAVRANRTRVESTFETGGPQHISYFMRDFVPERVEAFMAHDLRQATKDAASESSTVADSFIPSEPKPEPIRNRSSKRTRPPRLTVIRGDATGTTIRQTTVRTYLKCVETVRTEETNGMEF